MPPINAPPTSGGCEPVTDSAGAYSIGGLASGNYKVEFSSLNYASEWYDDQPDFDSATPVAVTLGEKTGPIDAALAPETALTAAALVGETVLQVASTEGFAVGDSILINPGGATEEENQIAGFGSLILALPLQFNHDPGEVIVKISEALDMDTDGDGCTDAQEAGPDERFGGRRDYLNFWDFYDPTGDGAVALSDFFALLQRFGTTDDGGQAPVNRFSNPLTTPDPGPGNYHPLIDRGTVIGANPWNLGPPNGAIALTDFFALLVQFGHSCQGG